MRQLLTANVRTHWQRYLATSIAIALATAFIVVCFGIVGGMKSSIERNLAEETRGADIVLRLKDGGEDNVKNALTVLEKDDKISAVAPRVSISTTVKQGSANSYGQMRTYPQEPFTAPSLENGVAPTRAGEAAIIKPFADAIHAKVGNTVTLVGLEEHTLEVKITGIVKAGAMSFNSVYLTEADLAKFGYVPSTIVVKSGAGVQHVKETLGANANNFEIATQAEDLDRRVQDMTGGETSIMLVLMIFPAIAAITAIIVISTTFQVMLTQRQRELALLRAIGAGRDQVKRLVVLETLIVGVVSAAFGTVLGLGASVALNVRTGLSDNALEAVASVSALQLVGTFLVGVAIALIAGYGPARRASNLSPMRALTGEDGATAETKRHWVRAGLGTISIGLSVALIAFSRHQIHNDEGTLGFALAFLGGLLGFAGALLLLSFLAAHFTQWLSRVFAHQSVTTALAGENTYRNPGRTGATITALVLGVTLVTMMLVGATSMEHTLNQGLVQSRPIDLAIQTSTPMNEKEVASLTTMEYVEAATAVQGVDLQAQVSGEGQTRTEPATVYRDTDLGSVTHAPLEALRADEIGVNGWLWVGDDMKVTLLVGEHKWELKPVVAKTSGYTVNPEVFDQIAATVKALPQGNEDGAGPGTGNPALGTRAVYMKFAADTTTSQASELTQKVTELLPGAQQSGGGFERLSMLSMINAVMLGALAMLAVSVVVALVGVSNTLSLSVVERQRENSLLRAIGMTRAGMRAMLVIEALLLAIVALALGFAMGIGFGWLGVISMPISDLVTPSLHVPWLALLGVAAVTVLAAVLASVMPGRRAARSAPVEALAQA